MTNYIVFIDTYYGRTYETNVSAMDEYQAIDIACEDLELEPEDVYMAFGTSC